MSKLDEYQMKVVNETGHCLVIAGPGSGKSTTICEKVKTLIANGTNESEILLISFTNKSVDDLKKKLGSDIFITTFHRLAIDILKYNKINYQIIFFRFFAIPKKEKDEHNCSSFLKTYFPFFPCVFC